MRFTQVDLDAFAILAQDPNPIHQGGVVYGMQLLARLEAALCQAHGWRACTCIDYRLTRPLMVNQAFTLTICGTAFTVCVDGDPIGQGVADGR